MRLSDYCSDAEWAKIKKLADEKETPFLVVDLEIIKQKYEELTGCFPMAKVHYALKANPGQPVIDLLRDVGSNFDCASIFELDKVLNSGVSPDRISYGNTIKKAAHVKYAYDKGIRLFATDSKSDLQNIAEYAPGSKVFVRILVEGGETAEWPLSRKFGCHPDMAIDLLVMAKQLGLVPYGISFHVGSQQKDIAVWDAALSKVKYMFDWMKLEEGIELKMINMGGGFPANYISEVNPINVYAEEILRYLHDDYGDEPGTLGDALARHIESRFGRLAKTALVLGLVVVGLHRLDLPQHLTDIAADIRHPVLTLPRQRAHPAAEYQNRRNHQRQRHQHDAAELGVGHHQQHAAAHQHDQVAQRHRQRRADHRLQQRGVGGQA